MADSVFLLAGLGNPGPAYHLTRHNIGFFFIDHLAGQHGLRCESLKLQGLYCRGRFGVRQVTLVKPQTYMNRSGECLRAFLDYFRIPVDHLLVIHDDIDLASGRIKIVAKGGTGGHNGIRSIAAHLGTDAFARMKIGVGRPDRTPEGQGQPVDRYVLSAMTSEELAAFQDKAPLVEEAVALFLDQGIGPCMNRINRR